MYLLKMGQEQSIENEGECQKLDIQRSEDDCPNEQPQKMICSNCKDSIATYRGKIVSDESDIVMKHLDIIDYWDLRIREEKGQYIVIYVGCDGCMKDEDKVHFTYVKEGWNEKLFVEDEYELVK